MTMVALLAEGDKVLDTELLELPLTEREPDGERDKVCDTVTEGENVSLTDPEGDVDWDVEGVLVADTDTVLLGDVEGVEVPDADTDGEADCEREGVPLKDLTTEREAVLVEVSEADAAPVLDQRRFEADTVRVLATVTVTAAGVLDGDGLDDTDFETVVVEDTDAQADTVFELEAEEVLEGEPAAEALTARTVAEGVPVPPRGGPHDPVCVGDSVRVPVVRGEAVTLSKPTVPEGAAVRVEDAEGARVALLATVKVAQLEERAEADGDGDEEPPPSFAAEGECTGERLPPRGWYVG